MIVIHNRDEPPKNSSTVYQFRSLGYITADVGTSDLGITCQERAWPILTYNLHAKLVSFSVVLMDTTPYRAVYLYQSRHCPKNGSRKLFLNVWMYIPIYTTSKARSLSIYVFLVRDGDAYMQAVLNLAVT